MEFLRRSKENSAKWGQIIVIDGNRAQHGGKQARAQAAQPCTNDDRHEEIHKWAGIVKNRIHCHATDQRECYKNTRDDITKNLFTFTRGGGMLFIITSLILVLINGPDGSGR